MISDVVSMNIDNPNSETVVLVGGGFGCLITALELSRTKNRPKIVLVEPRAKFVFLPLLYELLSDELNSWEVAPTYKSLVSDRGIVLIEEHVTSINTFEQIVFTSSGLQIKYSKVVLGTGSKPNDFDISGVKDHALMFHDLVDVKLLKALINKLKNCEINNHQLIIVGAGASGVELACKISDLLESKGEIHLVELGSRVLPQGKSFNQAQSERALNARGIRVHLETQVVAITARSVELKSLDDVNTPISLLPHSGLIWTTGSRAVFPAIIPDPPLINGKISIDSNLSVIGFENFLAIGDVACNKEFPCPSNAQVAIQQGVVAAANLSDSSGSKMLKAFEFEDFGEMLSLGIGNATITALGLTIAGPIAFQIRRLSYLTKMPNFSLRMRSAGSWIMNSTKKCKSMK